jgi:hypothetical protein
MKASKPLKDLPGFEEAFADFSEREANEGNWCDYGFPLRELGNIIAPGIYRIPDFRTLLQFARAIADTRSRRLRLVRPPLPVAANDCEAP